MDITESTLPAWLTLIDQGDGTASLSGTPTNAEVGTNDVVLVVSDGTAQTEQRFTVTVANVNDAPTISAIISRAVRAGQSAGDIPFTLADVDTAADTLTVSATSSNPALVPDNAISFGGSGADRTLSIQPLPGQLGSTTITVTVSDGSETASTSFTFTVSQVQLFLPMVRRPGAPDLVGTVKLTPSKASYSAGEPVQFMVTVNNQGSEQSDPAWADLYLNPATAPRAANVLWHTTCTLAPGESITLTSSPTSYMALYSRWPGWLAAGTTDVYLYVDSWNEGVATGAVAESDETNNRTEIRGLTVTGTNPSATGLTSAGMPERPNR